MTKDTKQKSPKSISTNKYSKIKDWYNREYRQRGDAFGVSIGAYKQFPRYLGWDIVKTDISHSGIPIYVSEQENTTYLDVACGQGYMMFFAKHYGIKNIYGADISSESIKLCKEKVKDAHYRITSAEKLSGYKNNFFDYITCIGSLEHFIDMNKALKRMHDVGKTNCKYCILVPNSKSWWKNKTEQREINERFYSLKEWSKLFTDNGFNIVKIYRDEWHIKKPQCFIKKILNFLTPLKYFNSFVFILEKNNEK